ncbi:MAG: trehalose-6-phosphate synthase, partial [Elusimicrobiota bacterium]
QGIECIMPASGVITAVEPVMKACGGTWVAHGAGNMDRETVDTHDRVRVPPVEPAYSLRRVWLTKEEENGYYYGFSNEGLWPLCHIAHTRPVFREADFNVYRQVNEKFAAAILEECKNDPKPLIFIQDYHFALLPRMIKKAKPGAKIALFWHIPWPNPEAFGICPWQRDLVYGMLGCDLIGFHIQFHCNNFMETVERSIESRIDWERFTVIHQNHSTVVKPFPISIPFKPSGTDLSIFASAKERVAKELGMRPGYLGVGVDRLDYTKGIIERFHAVERFLEKNPRYVGDFTFVQIGAPSREHIDRYKRFIETVGYEAQRINDKFRNDRCKAIVFLKGYHSHQEIEPYYQAADFCLVTSLHDGMNLVAKEYINSRWDDDGALILSQFAGASRELASALLVNPYDIEQVADAIRYCLEMDDEERARRMRRLRNVLREKNIYRWAATLISELVQIRAEAGASMGRKQSAQESVDLPMS